jgi:LexA DNA binding domain-containing protein
MAAKYTPRQGQYLAFIYHYSKVNARPPAEADLQKHFGVSAPSIHQMILTLEKRGLISRTPGAPRSIRVLVPLESLPALGSSSAPPQMPRTLGENVMVQRRQRQTPPRAAEASKQTPALDRLKGDEAARLLHAILDRHPELASELRELASSELGHVSVEDVAHEVEAAVDMLDLDDLNDRAGSHASGYIEPTEAAWELVEEAVAPFIEDIQRRADAGEHAAALITCAGVVLGLYRLRDKGSDEFLGWAVDSPDEFAGEAVVTLRKASRTSTTSCVTPTLPAVLRDVAPEWTEMLERCWKRPD